MLCIFIIWIWTSFSAKEIYFKWKFNGIVQFQIFRNCFFSPNILHVFLVLVLNLFLNWKWHITMGYFNRSTQAMYYDYYDFLYVTFLMNVNDVGVSIFLFWHSRNCILILLFLSAKIGNFYWIYWYCYIIEIKLKYLNKIVFLLSIIKIVLSIILMWSE